MSLCATCGYRHSKEYSCDPATRHQQIVDILKQIIADPDAARMKSWQRLEEMGLKSELVH
jgi:uncharacterized protein YciW